MARITKAQQRINDARYRIYYAQPDAKKMSEDGDQVSLFSWAEINYPEYKFFHVPNETRGSKFHYIKRQQMGVRGGVSDLISQKPSGQWSSCALEIKRVGVKMDAVSDDQHKYLNFVADNGGFAAVCFGCEAGKLAILDYVAGKK